jgi:hypothetical protein
LIESPIFGFFLVFLKLHNVFTQENGYVKIELHVKPSLQMVYGFIWGFMRYLIFFLFIGSRFLLATSDQKETLNELALKAHADKASDYHNYTAIYARYFDSLREQPIKFLEIGICKGNSVKLWEEYFFSAEMHFIDITLDNVEYFSKRAQYHVANQESPQDLQKFITETGGNFDVIIDDGGHTMNQQIISFQHLFPHVKSGGMYIIEDLHTSYWPGWGKMEKIRGLVTLTTIEYLKSLIDEVNFVGYRTGCASHQKIDPSIQAEMNIYRESIESIHFYDSMAIITKR